MNVMKMVAKVPVVHELVAVAKMAIKVGKAVYKQINELKQEKEKLLPRDKPVAVQASPLDLKVLTDDEMVELDGAGHRQQLIDLGDLADYGYNPDGTLSHSMASTLERAKYLIAAKLGETLVPLE